ncbi:MAG: hypothetical protein KAS95_06965, partial [Candidatus Heimdallarchaeota archaeon]|nr:hypothetical protein [Candidatus Heimdallarchaeota archaeon]
DFADKFSLVVIFLEVFTSRYWATFLLFIPLILLTTFLSFLITKTYWSDFRSNIKYLKLDLAPLSTKAKIKILVKDFSKIVLVSLIVFALTEILVFAASSIILTFLLPIVVNDFKLALTPGYTIFLISHIILYPLFTWLYQRLISKRLVVSTSIDLREFMNEEGDIDLRKWRDKTWGKKPYSYDWDSEEFYPIVCPSCASVISSNFTECPICQADLKEEIEEIIEEMKNQKDSETDTEENTIGKEKMNEKSDNNTIK